MATTDMNAQIHIKDGNGNVNNIFPATKIANVEGLTAALNAKADTTTVNNQLSGKVDKETGKGLSTNDYTTAEKNKLSGIEAQANKTTVDSALSSSSENPVQNKVINTALGTKADSSTVTTLTSRVSDVESDIATQTSRIDNIVALPSGSTQGDAELMDIRVKADGDTASSAGDAVRGQVSEIYNDVLYSETLLEKVIPTSGSGFVETVTTHAKKGEMIRFTVSTANPVNMFYTVFYTDGSTRDYSLNVEQYMMNYDHIVTKDINTVRIYRNSATYADLSVKIERLSCLDVAIEDYSNKYNAVNLLVNGIKSGIMGKFTRISSMSGKRLLTTGIENAQNNNWFVDIYDISNYEGLINLTAYTRFIGDYAWIIFNNSELSTIDSKSTLVNKDNLATTFEDSIVVSDSPSKYLAVQSYGGGSSVVSKMYVSGEDHDYKKKCSRIINNGKHIPFTVVDDSGGNVIRVINDGLNEFGDMAKKVFVDRTTESNFYLNFSEAIPMENVSSVTVRMRLPLYTTAANGKHSGYFAIAPKTTGTPSPTPVQFKVYSNSECSYGDFTLKIPRSRLVTSYATGNLTGLQFKCIPRSTVEDWFGGWSIVDVTVNQKMKPCILFNFDQVWKESIDNGGYNLFYNNGIKFSMFTDNYATMDKTSVNYAELIKMEQYGNELSAYGGLTYGSDLPVSDVMDIVEHNLTDLADITDKPMFSYGCRQHYGNSKLINLLRMRGVKAIRFNPNALPLGCFTKNDYMIPAIEITDQKSAQDIIDIIDECIENGSCLPLFTHGICATGAKYMKFDDGTLSTSEGVPLDKMTTIINYVKSKMDAGKIECITFNEFVNSCY